MRRLNRYVLNSYAFLKLSFKKKVKEMNSNFRTLHHSMNEVFCGIAKSK